AVGDGARADGVPVPERTPAEPSRAEPPSRDKLLGRDATARDGRDRGKAAGDGNGRNAGQPGKPGPVASSPTDRDALLGKVPGDAMPRETGLSVPPAPAGREALLGKAPVPTPTRFIPTPADLLGRKPLQNTPQPPGRDKDGGRER
ncbi:MAG: hypothetical protein KGL20_00940, partial [Rhodospirillales bacterium]|nr:hypothetical protein [Rhodospirillales bacterium]MDE2457783.1 hypothetical protein [Rhodospirillales bacterium]